MINDRLVMLLRTNSEHIWQPFSNKISCNLQMKTLNILQGISDILARPICDKLATLLRTNYEGIWPPFSGRITTNVICDKIVNECLREVC